jgi:hypothetical protein
MFKILKKKIGDFRLGKKKSVMNSQKGICHVSVHRRFGFLNLARVTVALTGYFYKKMYGRFAGQKMTIARFSNV